MNTAQTHILVVDDDPFTAEMTGMILEEEEYEIILSDGGLDALGKLANDPLIRIVVSDMNMPGISGIKLFTGMRERGFNLPFVLLTGDDSPPLRLEYPDLDAIVTKDADLEEILPEIVASLLAKSGVQS
ncbi:MAG: response regulator [Desulfuromonadaceae bacterium]|nr:response regulator [Desulfuromonadaceae bacterium]MDD5105716.1 response regulator [Desulfuromonadaceae bacterium]